MRAALVAALVGLLLVTALTMVIWIGEPRTSAPIGDVLRTAGAFWLLGHGARLHLPDGTVGLIPLGLSLLFAVLARRAGAKVARVRPAARRGRAVLGCALCVAVPYAVTAALVATVVSGDAVRVTSLRAALGAFVLALLAAALGAARALPRTGPGPGFWNAAVSGLVAATAVVIAASACCAAVVLVTHLTDAAELARPEKAGVVGGIGLLAIQAALAPNLLAWVHAYALGPGFAIGAGTVVSPGRVQLGDVPGLPMLAGLPGSAAPWPVYVLFVIGPAAGVLAGIIALRRLRRTPRWWPALGLAAVLTVSVGVVSGLVAAASGGPVAAGRLETVGPSPLLVGAFAALEIGVPALLTTVGLVGYRRVWLTRETREVSPSMPVGERLSGWRTAASAKLRWRRNQSQARVEALEQPTVVDLTKHDVSHPELPGAAAEPVVDLTKHERGEPPGDASDDAAIGWDAELTQELDLSALEGLPVASTDDPLPAKRGRLRLRRRSEP